MTTDEKRRDYLEKTQMTALQAALLCRRNERGQNTTDRRKLARRRLKLEDLVIDVQRELTLIDARLKQLDKPTQQEIDSIVALRNQVRAAMQANQTVTAVISLANAAFNFLDGVRGS